ncbi:MAG: ABC transporter permease [Nitrospiraceae bacterium]|nr:ABC transporter permease [Nitrospiraceae bacterium]
MKTIVSAETSPNRTPISTQVAQPTVVIEAHRSWWELELYELWKYRELILTICWRDIKTRYTQSMIGVGWLLISPLFTIAVMTVIFSYWAKIPSDGVPYPLFVYSAMLPWGYFSKSLERSSTSVANESSLITKVYFPRVIIPIASTLGGLVDCVVGFVLVIAMGLWFGITPTWGILTLPLLLGLAFATALAISLWFTAIHVRYHDIAAVTGILVQVWMYASPVIYPLSMVPEQWRVVYSLNPMVGVIEGFRWALLGKASPDLLLMTISMVIVFVILAGGYLFFKKMERSFADVI